MAQHAKNASPLIVDQSIIQQYIARQGTKTFIRSISDHMESVSYTPESSLRFWYNDSMNSYDPHWHGACEMIVPVEGSYLVSVRSQTYELTPGDIFLIPGGELHSLKAPSRGGRFILLFDLEPIWRISGFSYLASCLSAPVLINRSTCPSIYMEEAALFGQLCADYLSSDPMRDVTIYVRLLTFLMNYGKNRMSAESGYAISPSPHINHKSYSEKFGMVFSYLDEHFAEDLTLERVAAVAGFSKFHFSRIFKQLSGSNFYDYLSQRRIRSAEMLLMKPEISISQIALQSGFSSVTTFNRTFKKLKNCTPTQYRSMFQVQTGISSQRRP